MLRLYAIAALALAALGAGAYVVHLQHKASRVDAAEAAQHEAEAGRAADMAEVVKRLDADAKQRGELMVRLDGIDKRFSEIKIPDPKVLVQTREVPGACPVTSVSDEFVRLYNQTASP